MSSGTFKIFNGLAVYKDITLRFSYYPLSHTVDQFIYSKYDLTMYLFKNQIFKIYKLSIVSY